MFLLRHLLRVSSLQVEQTLKLLAGVWEFPSRISVIIRYQHSCCTTNLRQSSVSKVETNRFDHVFSRFELSGTEVSLPLCDIISSTRSFKQHVVPPIKS